MDRVYELAILTIVAALESRDGASLPGYKRPRKARNSLWSPFLKGDIEMGAPFLPSQRLRRAVNGSLWNTRGWTFQERVLSERCLFVTEYGFFFQCPRSQIAEEMTWEHEDLKRFLNTSPAISPETLQILSSGHRLRSTLLSLPHLLRTSRHWLPRKFRRLHQAFIERRIAHRHRRDDVRAAPMITGWDVFVQQKDRVGLPDYMAWVQNYTTRQLSFKPDVLSAF
ncbi:hypothetical protein V8E51_011084, partial [Hyaloscypha variabilis]